MTFRGQVKNGVIVLDGAPALAEGTVVQVEPVDVPTKPKRGRAEAIMQVAGLWESDKDVIDRLLAELKAMKSAEAKAQLENEGPNPLDER